MRGKKPRSSGPSRSIFDRDDLRPLNLRRAIRILKLGGAGDSLLQTIYRVHHSLKFRPIQQIERALFSRKHLKRHTPRSRHHPSRFLRRKIACRDRFDRQLNQDSQPTDTPALVVDLFLRRAGNNSVFRSGLWHFAK